MRTAHLIVTLGILSVPGLFAAGSAQAPDRARELMGRGDYRAAAVLLQEKLSARPGDAESLFALGVCLSQTGDPPGAEKALRQYTKLRPADADGHAVLGLVLHSAGRSDEARPELRRALQLQPGNVEAAKALAHIESVALQFAAVRGALLPVRKSPEFDPDSRFLLAGAEAALGNWTSALVELDRVIRDSAPPSREAFLLASTAAARTGQAARVLQFCESGARLYPHDDRLTAACLAVQDTKAFEDRLNERLASLRANPGNSAEAIALGRLLTDAAGGKNERLRAAGLDLLRSAAKSSPGDASARYNLGRALRLARQPGDALPELERALALSAGAELRVLALMHTAQAHENLNRPGEAASAYRLMMQTNRELRPPLAMAAFAYCEFLSAQGDEKAAGELASEILHWDPMYLPARLVLARRLEASGDAAGAIREAERVVAFGSSADKDSRAEAVLRHAHTLLLRTYASQGDRDRAAKHRAWLDAHKSDQGAAPR